MYLYIFEDGTAAKSKTAPESVDLEAVADGVLQIFFMSEEDIKEVDEDGSLDAISTCVVSVDEYHYLP